MSYTPGPWATDGRCVYVLHRRDDGLMENRFYAGIQGPHCPDEEKEANARLISAAPDLLEALETAYLRLIGMDYPQRSTADGQAELCAIRDAIAKASGEDSFETQMRFENKAMKILRGES